MKKCYLYRVEGIVQGVGFRPFVYTLATKYLLFGYVLNDSKGVKIVVEGDIDNLKKFDYELKNSLPPLARVDFLEKKEDVLRGYDTFEIRKSSLLEIKQTLVSPDMSICNECLNELNDKDNYRYNYPFINCTNCGPRYSIIKKLPYDRKNTSMSDFIMCETCKSEYINPLDRRYHAQPISCDKCGPTLYLKSIKGEVLQEGEGSIERFAKLIEEGSIVAMKGIGGFHLICDAKNDKVIRRLREKKRRPTKPFAIMFKDINQLKKYTILTDEEIKAIESIQRPIVIVKKSNESLSSLVAPGIDRLGVFLPYTPLHVILFKYLKTPIIATSANRSGEPICSNENDLQEALSGVIEYYLDYNREIVNFSDDSVLQIVYGHKIFIRSSRGYMPGSFRYEGIKKRVLALGAHQKSAIALYFDNQVVLSPYIGDLENIKSFEAFKGVLKTFKRFYDFEPDLIVCDKHPGYFTTQFANSQQTKVKQVQHHYAHILSTMFEYKIKEDVLGVAWDGTGYGDDGSVWGGEFFVCNKEEYKRVAFFEPFRLLGGDKSIKDIKRVALSILIDISQDNIELRDRYKEFLSSFKDSELKTLIQIHAKGINSPLCSSVGRLFDGVASFCGLCDSVSYDGESGLVLEKLYDSSIDDSYNIYLDNGIIRYKHIFKEIQKEKNSKIIATKFINSLANIIFDIHKFYNMDIVLGGGVFQNRVLLEKIIKIAKNRDIKLYFPTKSPINDSSISLGQLYSII